MTKCRFGTTFSTRQGAGRTRASEMNDRASITIASRSLRSAPQAFRALHHPPPGKHPMSFQSAPRASREFHEPQMNSNVLKEANSSGFSSVAQNVRCFNCSSHVPSKTCPCLFCKNRILQNRIAIHANAHTRLDM